MVGRNEPLLVHRGEQRLPRHICSMHRPRSTISLVLHGILPQMTPLRYNRAQTKINSLLGWHQGRTEFRSRALGARSIFFGDARSYEMQRTLNLKVKYRESLRPFSPAVLAEDVADGFDYGVERLYMLMVGDVLERHRIAMFEEQRNLFGIDLLSVPRSTIPAVTHVDHSVLIQTAHRETNPRFHNLLSRFKALAGYPVVVNNGFNIRGEPIVATPEDAFSCFMGTEPDTLAVGNS